MRRAAQTTRNRTHHAHTQSALVSDDLGMLKDADPSYATADVDLHTQLLTKEREQGMLNDRIKYLQKELEQRPPAGEVEELHREYRNLEMILQGTQRENAKCMAELDKRKLREKELEKELCNLLGEGWRSSLNIPAETSTLESSFDSLSPKRRPNPVADDSRRGNTSIHLHEVSLLVSELNEKLDAREATLQALILDAQTKVNSLRHA